MIQISGSQIAGGEAYIPGDSGNDQQYFSLSQLGGGEGRAAVGSREVVLLLGVEARNAAKPFTTHGAAPQQRIILPKILRELQLRNPGWFCLILFLFFIESHFLHFSNTSFPDLMGSFECLASEIRWPAAAEKYQVFLQIRDISAHQYHLGELSDRVNAELIP